VATRIKQEVKEERTIQPASTKTEAFNDSETVESSDNCEPEIQIFSNMTTLNTTLIETFDCDNNLNLAVRWDLWTIRLDHYFAASNITDDAQKVATLFLIGGSRLFELHRSLPQTVTDATADTEYKKALSRLNTYFNPKRNKVYENFMFSQARQNKAETIEQYVTRLRGLSRYCEFTNEDDEIVKHVVQSCFSKDLRMRFLEKDDLKINQLQKKGRTFENVRFQVEAFDGNESYNDGIEAVEQKR